MAETLLSPETAIKRREAIDVTTLEPKDVWTKFAAISAIPRDSGKEGEMRQYVEGWAKELEEKYKVQVTVRKDELGNISVSIPATKGHEHIPALCFQSHMDMVCKKRLPNGQSIPHDFGAEPMRLRKETEGEKEYVCAEGTTLGADNGIGLVVQMNAIEQILGSGEPHGKLVALFTADEEDSTDPAIKFSAAPHGMEDVHHLVNLDGDKRGQVWIECAGYQELKAKATIDGKPYIEYKVRLSGLPGGHSGLEAWDETRPNALLVLQNELSSVLPDGAQIVSRSGGLGKGAIPSSAECVIRIPDGVNVDVTWQDVLKERIQSLWDSHIVIDHIRASQSNESPKNRPAYGVDIEARRLESDVQRKRMQTLLAGIPTGVLGRNADLTPNLSSNVVLRIADGGNTYELEAMIRGVELENIERITNDTRTLLSSVGFGVTTGNAVPGYSTSTDSDLVQLAIEAVGTVEGKPAKVVRSHAFQETGPLSRALQAEAVTLCATIQGEHEPDKERVEISSVEALDTTVRELYRRFVAKHEKKTT